jgi:polyferredoxin
MIAKRPWRQRIRRLALLLSLLVFPITLNYFSPYVIIEASRQGIINGSLLNFALMFVLASFFGRLWCAWVCPAAGLQEVLFDVQPKRFRGGWRDAIKWVIWVPWIGLIGWLALRAGGYGRVDPWFMTDRGISVSESANYIVFYAVLFLFAVIPLLAGRRAACHTVCWMAPFMILGRKLRNLVGWPALRLRADRAKCVDCGKCTQQCTMSLDVHALVQAQQMEHAECILCGNCIDGCPQDVIHYAFRAGKD